MLMTEFGAAEDIKGDLYALEKSVQQADKHKQSWMYWQFKYFQDITTCTPTGESMYNEDGTPNAHKLRVLSRAYPQAVAGAVDAYHFDPILSKFTLTYAPSTTLPSRTTEIYVNRGLAYRLGAHVSITENGSDVAATGVTVQCTHLNNVIEVIHSPTFAATNVTVTITPCVPLVTKDCNCL